MAGVDTWELKKNNRHADKVIKKSGRASSQENQAKVFAKEDAEAAGRNRSAPLNQRHKAWAGLGYRVRSDQDGLAAGFSEELVRRCWTRRRAIINVIARRQAAVQGAGTAAMRPA